MAVQFELCWSGLMVMAMWCPWKQGGCCEGSGGFPVVGKREGVNHEGRGKGWGKENELYDAGIHTGGGEMATFSLFENPPPL